MSILLTFIVLVVAVWLILEYLCPKLPAPLNTIVTIITVIIAIVWLLGLVFPALKQF